MIKKCNIILNHLSELYFLLNSLINQLNIFMSSIPNESIQSLFTRKKFRKPVYSYYAKQIDYNHLYKIINFLEEFLNFP